MEILSEWKVIAKLQWMALLGFHTIHFLLTLRTLSPFLFLGLSLKHVCVATYYVDSLYNFFSCNFKSVLLLNPKIGILNL